MGPRPRSKPSASNRPATRPAPVEEEIIDINNVTSGDEDEDAGGANTPGKVATRVAPVTIPVIKSHKAVDVDLIFDRKKGENSVCKYCR